jgi:hypothetical protein
MDHFTTDTSVGIRINNDTHLIEIQIDKNKTNIHIKINDNIKHIDNNFINQYITPNFSVEMFYYVMYNFLKYNNFKLSYNQNYYTFEGYYTEHYEQSDIIHIKFDI